VAVIRRTASKVLSANLASMFSEICATPVQDAYPSDGPIMEVLLSPIMPYLLERHKLRDYDRWRGVFDADSAGREGACECWGATRSSVPPHSRGVPLWSFVCSDVQVRSEVADSRAPASGSAVAHHLIASRAEWSRNCLEFG